MTQPMGSGINDAMLHVLQGAQQGQSFPLIAPEMELGREGGALDLSRYGQMSRQHARLFCENGDWSIQDLGSMNGTHVNSERIATRRLRDGDIIKMGDFSARVSLPGQAWSTPSSDHTQIAPEPSAPPTQLIPPAPHPWPQQPAPQYPPPNYPAPQPVPPQNYPQYPPAYPPPGYQVNHYAPITPPKNPGLAAVLSFLFCGLGQFYNGEVNKGIGFWIAGFIAGLLTCAVIGWFILPALWIFSIIDAYQSAEEINRRSQM